MSADYSGEYLFELYSDAECLMKHTEEAQRRWRKGDSLGALQWLRWAAGRFDEDLFVIGMKLRDAIAALEKSTDD